MPSDSRETGKSHQPHPRRLHLRPGYTTGSCAAAAARACVEQLLLHKGFAPTSLLLPSGERLVLQPVNPRMGEGWAGCGIIKDAGDDPDVTDGIEIRARITLNSQPGNDIRIAGGDGVGRITKEGLELPPGEPAINPVPRRMIRDNVREILKEANYAGSVIVEISVPQGELTAVKTINARLGIVGGISILGTTGLVEPVSALAWQDTIVACLKVAKASGCERVVLSPGRSSEAAAIKVFPHWPHEAFILMGDYAGFSLDAARKFGFRQIIISAQFAKLVKIAQGCIHTHVHHSTLDMAWLSASAQQAGYGQETLAFISRAHTARQVYQYFRQRSDGLFFSTLVDRISRDLGVRCILFSYEGEKIADSQEEGRGGRAG
ncbi:MAG: cobalt-precorrin-5B (C(1))-methyltransferase CbiD [bacterium]